MCTEENDRVVFGRLLGATRYKEASTTKDTKAHEVSVLVDACLFDA